MTVKAVVIVNKWWEANALVSVIEHSRDVKADLSASPGGIAVSLSRSPRNAIAQARLICRVGDHIVEVWCIEDLLPLGSDSSSSSLKRSLLEPFLAQSRFSDSCVIAFGTAACPKEDQAGSVVIGSSVYVYDESLQDERLHPLSNGLNGVGVIVESPSATMLDGGAFDESLHDAKARFVIAPKSGAISPTILCGSRYVAVSVINVPNTDHYKTVDFHALRGFSTVCGNLSAESIDTTLGLVRLCSDKKFLYVAGIANQVGRFEIEVKPNRYAQNFAASHNAAVCLAWMLTAFGVT